MPGEPVVRVFACIERKDDTIGGYSQFSPLWALVIPPPFRFFPKNRSPRGYVSFVSLSHDAE
jgi:hypothetical protein